MIEKILHQIIAELGPTGLLVVGLYYLLHKPLCELVKCVCEIQQEIKVLVVMSKILIRRGNGKTNGTTTEFKSQR